MIAVQYYRPQTAGECFRTAISNLLLEMHDEEAAERAFTEYPSHPLTFRDGGMFLGVAPRVVRDITHERYRGRIMLFCIGPEEIRRDLPKLQLPQESKATLAEL